MTTTHADTVLCGQDGSPLRTVRGAIYCTWHGTDDVPSWDELTLNLPPASTLTAIDGLLYVVGAS